MAATYKGDDTRAFGGNLVKVTLTGAEGKFISRAIFQCGRIQKAFTRPVFPLYINFTSEETEYMWDKSECFLQIFDVKGRGKTCKGSFTIITNS
jgi:hypothetical protein